MCLIWLLATNVVFPGNGEMYITCCALRAVLTQKRLRCVSKFVDVGQFCHLNAEEAMHITYRMHINRTALKCNDNQASEDAEVITQKEVHSKWTLMLG